MIKMTENSSEDCTEYERKISFQTARQSNQQPTDSSDNLILVSNVNVMPVFTSGEVQVSC